MSHYPSKRDPWLVVLLWVAILIQIVVGILIWMTPGRPVEQWIVTGLVVVSAMFSLHVLYGTAYDLTNEELKVRCGVLRWRVPLASIRRIAPTRSLWSGPALSLERLEVRYDRARWPLYISPDDPERLTQDIVDRCASLRIVGENRVERTSNA
ncbi:MAG: PH domain-containing protein [Planctomycetaceae bacterium]|nr:PH domain-containing protein [Planctomycetaceae bacterium]